jgi:hypothetical protein
MQKTLYLALLFSFSWLSGQKINPEQEILLVENTLKTDHYEPLTTMDGLVVDRILLPQTPDFIDKVDVSKGAGCSYIEKQGWIIINTKKEANCPSPKSITPHEIALQQGLKGQVIYALDGYALLDTKLDIAQEAIKAIEVQKVQNPVNLQEEISLLNIWVLPKENRVKTVISRPCAMGMPGAILKERR